MAIFILNLGKCRFFWLLKLKISKITFFSYFFLWIVVSGYKKTDRHVLEENYCPIIQVNVVLLLGQHRRQWANIKTAFPQRSRVCWVIT